MTLLELQDQLKTLVRAKATEIYGEDPGKIAVEVPPKTEFGDLAFPIAFELAKRLKASTGEKQNPRKIAEEIRSDLLALEIVQDVQIAGPGYLNVFLDRPKLLNLAVSSEPPFKKSPDSPGKICVEHTSVNPNKAAHIGHLRNSVLGDTFVRILRSAGEDVEIQNYIDNTGVQVADVVVGFIHMEGMDLEAIKSLDAKLQSEGKNFDFYCWDLYTRVGIEYQSNESLVEKRAETLHSIEEGDNKISELADYVATRNVECILKTMERISIRYDLLPRESEILHLHFWQKAFEMMKERKVIQLSESGKHEGCWVMPFESHEGSDDHENDKILVRSNGTVTYTGKDIAYQMWKLGLLGLDFKYRPFTTYKNGQEVWITTANDKRAIAPKRQYGSAGRVYNVIDTRQSYPQQVVKQGVATIFPEKGEAASVHLSYEMVALSPRAAEELGFKLSEEDRQKSFIEMSGRKGLGVKADDMIDRLEKNALEEVSERNPDLEKDKQENIARQIAVGALRYFLLKFTKNTVIVFDFKEATAFEGETGTYCQNATVRLNSIFRKLDSEIANRALDSLDSRREKLVEYFGEKEGNGLWAVVILALRLEESVKQAITQAEPAVIARYTFNLSKASNLFYQKHRILDEKDEDRQALLIAIAETSRRALTASLAIMGIEVPERM
ncbi:MAG: arginine--tRNA ligase [Pyrinomonadaceae bacterium]|nr:arginine--tRNA ligase [Pyrinomonadaceae bacterium]